MIVCFEGSVFLSFLKQKSSPFLMVIIAPTLFSGGWAQIQLITEESQTFLHIDEKFKNGVSSSMSY